MFVYNEKIENELFVNNKEYTSLKIITGYITPKYIKKIYESFLGKIDIYLGMGDTKYKKSTYDSIKSILKEIEDERLNVFYTNMDVHSKIYYWSKENVRKVLIGSANFSDSINQRFKEVLGDNDSEEIDLYCNYIFSNSTLFKDVDPSMIKDKPVRQKTPIVDNIITGDNSALLSLLSSSTKNKGNIFEKTSERGQVPTASGLNWGLSKNPSNMNDAYLSIPMLFIRESELFKRTKQESNLINVLWDDGTKMQLMCEGTNNYNGNQYYKQISSLENKHALGVYLRERIGKKINKDLLFPLDSKANKDLKKKIRENESYKRKYLSKMITYDILRKYGRFDIEITYQGDDTYYFDFSTK